MNWLRKVLKIYKTFMFNCLKKCFKSIFRFKSPKNHVKIYDNIFIAHEKENQVFEESLIFLETSNKYPLKDYENSFVRKFYNFELLVELFNRFYKKMNISEHNLSYINYAFEELNIAFRFNMIWYYNSANIHLRIFIENIVNFVYFHFWEFNLVENVERDWLKVKIEKCFKKWQFSYKNENPKDKDVYDKYYFNADEYYKIYKHLSNNFIHKTNNIESLKFDENKFNDFFVLFTLSLMFSARFLKVTIWYDIEQNWKNKILKQIDDYSYYWNYLQFLFNENKIITNQYSGLYNLIHDNKELNLDLIYNKIGLIEKNLFSPEYLENIRVSDFIMDKAEWDREKYKDLFFRYYKNKRKTNK